MTMLDELINKEFQYMMLESSAFWLNMLDKNANVSLWNKAAENISGYYKEEVLGKATIWELLYPDEEYRTFIFAKALKIISNGQELIDFETTILTKHGRNVTLSWNTHNVKDLNGDIVGSIAIARDVTKIKEHEKQLEVLTKELEESNARLRELSYTDELTNIANRRAYDEKIKDELVSAQRSGKELSLCMIDIDLFKDYNDTYGHEKGDVVLFRVANEIKNTLLRKTDFLARYGGEEIVIVLPFTSLEQTKEIVTNILENIRALHIKHSVSEHSETLTISAGIASTTSGYDNLLSHADKALYRAKEKGRNRLEIYSK